MECIISLTSWKKRINSDILKYTIFSFIQQQKVCDFKVVLVLSEDEFPKKETELPKDLVALLYTSPNAELLWTKENTKSYKKYFPVRRAYPDSTIITVDDDSPAKPNFLPEIWKTHLQYPDRVIYGYNHVLPGVTKNGCIDNVRYGFGVFPPGSLYDLDEHFGRKYFIDMDDEFMRLLHVLGGTHYCAINAYSVLIMQAGEQQVAMGKIMGNQWGKISSMWSTCFKANPQLKTIWDKNKKIRN